MVDQTREPGREASMATTHVRRTARRREGAFLPTKVELLGLVGLLEGISSILTAMPPSSWRKDGASGTAFASEAQNASIALFSPVESVGWLSTSRGTKIRLLAPMWRERWVFTSIGLSLLWSSPISAITASRTAGGDPQSVQFLPQAALRPARRS